MFSCDVIKIDLRGVDWIPMAEDGDQWLALLNAIIDLRVS